MKNYCTKALAPLRSTSDLLRFLTALTVMLAAAPSMAAERKITEVELEQDKNQLEIKLAASTKADAQAGRKAAPRAGRYCVHWPGTR